MKTSRIPLKKNNPFRQNRDIDTKKIKNYIKILKYPKDEFIEYGSYKIGAQPFPSDIDGTQNIELIKLPLTKKEASVKAANIVKSIVKKILNTRTKAYLGDIKAGIDIFFVINYENNECYDIKTYDLEGIKENLKYLYDKNMITEQEYEKIKHFAIEFNNTNNIEHYALLADEYRKLTVLRWDRFEIEKNKKILSGNRKITLENAILQSDNNEIFTSNNRSKILKVDMFALTNGKYLEITNLLSISFNDKVTNKIDQLTYGRTSSQKMIEGLQNEVTRYYYSLTPKFKNYIKYCKRLFSLSLIFKDKSLADILIDVFQSEYNKLYQLNSEIGVFIDIYEYSIINDYKYDIKNIKKILDEMKQKFSVIISLPDDLLDEIIHYLNILVYDELLQESDFISILENLHNIIKDFINDNVLEWLKDNNLFPINDKRYFDPSYLIFPFY